MAFVPSPDQELAINTRDRTILVSAAAGSGKTTTLTERIIKSLLDPTANVSVQNMLIVTFTRPAVASLMRKVGEALTKALASIREQLSSEEDPDKIAELEKTKSRFEEELYLLPAARIQTIDSFCSSIVRASTSELGIPPNFRIAEEAEIRILSDETLTALIKAAYEGELEGEGISPKDFDELVTDITSARRTGEITDVLLSLYDKCKNAIRGVAIFDDYANIYLQKGDFKIDDTEYGRDVVRHAREVIEYVSDGYYALSDMLALGSPAESGESAYYSECAARIKGLNLAGYDSAKRSVSGLEFPKRAEVKANDKTELIDLARKKETGSLKAKLTNLYNDFFLYTPDMWQELFSRMHKSLTTLSRVMHVFDKTYMAEKLRRNMFEYSDIERFAYNVLYDEDGTRSEFAKSYAQSLDAVYIDEYQDVNELQDAVFLAVSNGKNRFMVGDIKQSIYVFRSAKPEIFASLKRDLPLLTEKPDPNGNSIFMSENYRCDRGIVDFVNDVFKKMFAIAHDSIEYRPEDALSFAKKYGKDGCDPEPEYKKPEVCLVEGVIGDDNKYTSREPEYIAERIDDLLKNGRLNVGRKLEDGSVDYSVHPDDIAVIVRTWTPMPAIVDALEARGIEVEHGIDREFFMNADIRLVLCLLNAIDNPSKDVYLAGLMCSPLFGFTADDLVRYRGGERTKSLYRSIKEYRGGHPEDSRLSDFLDRLSHYRTLSESLNVYTLISRLYDETGVFALASERGEAERLITLYNYARKYESASYKGLYKFITYINNVITIGKDIEEKGGTESSGAIRIFSVHGSKGLEFPIVIYADASHPLTCLDTRNRVLFSEGYGIGYYLRAKGSIALAENPVKHIIANRMEEKFYEEELRTLYVTLTRAAEQLIIVGRLSKGETEEDVLAGIEFKRRTSTLYGIRCLTSHLDIILASTPKADLKFIPAPEEERVYDLSGEVEENTATADQDKRDEAKAPAVRDEALYKKLKERFTYAYPYHTDTLIPEKMSISSLTPALLDELEEMSIFEARKKHTPTLPEFIAGKGERLSREEGTATHMMLQFADLRFLKENGARRELERLVAKRFLSKERAALVRLDEIELFRSSDLIDEMLFASGTLCRELRFNVHVDATLLAESDEKRNAVIGKEVLVQGVIDCIITDGEGNIHLIDYKTDRIKHPENAAKQLAESHSQQLSYYALAIEKMFGKRPTTVRIYSLPLGRCVDIEPLF